MGLDATVVYPDVDLVIGNPLPVPITVRARADGGRMQVELWARARPIEVEWRRELVARTHHDERVVEDPRVPPGERLVSQEGGPGFVIDRVRVIRDNGVERTERRTLRYPPTDRVVRVAPGQLAGGVSPLAQEEVVLASSAGSAPAPEANTSIEPTIIAPPAGTSLGPSGAAASPGEVE
jgi:hypothetical protein